MLSRLRIVNVEVEDSESIAAIANGTPQMFSPGNPTACSEKLSKKEKHHEFEKCGP
jgi:hypothetical protein